MNIKNESIDKIKKVLQIELDKITTNLKRNTYNLKELVHNQTVLKREKTKIHEVLNILEKSKMEAKK